ncbi:initiator tRNA phosphoribosyl transferase [Pholiota conissans]|uniref:Initiator tRNA phosphoribosyl transferase n=1 Tax=Pholiota conissans TaxID=109636 RepID=A0A9P6CZH2_9AGAR|nr:initiator tRNA phosphoribosyl transferase [Pholiota conissans]
MSNEDPMFDDFTKAFAYIRKESLDIYNRLHSIEEDVAFIEQAHKAYPNAPLLRSCPNLRCGAWYTDPSYATHVPAYFKSTDGHNNNWSFNLRRANLHLIPLIIERKGIILVDSTRSGKRIPDALSKTVPIWCAVINRAMLLRYPALGQGRAESCWNVALYTPPSTVSRQEHHQIELRLDDWARDLAGSSFALPIIPRPLRPVWITPATSAFPNISFDEKQDVEFIPVVCVSASKQVDQGLERRAGGFSYIQGSGDDHELWGAGLTPELFWANHSRLLAAERTQLPAIVSEIVSRQPKTPSIYRAQNAATPVNTVGGRLLLASLAEIPEPSNDQGDIIYILLTSTTVADSVSTKTQHHIPVVSGKKGQSHFLQTILPDAMKIISESLYNNKNVCVACETGKDISVGVVLAALQLYFGDDGSLSSASVDTAGAKVNATVPNKNSIRTRLQWIIESRPEANPSRAVLKRVNEFLLTSPAFRERPAS